jgi:transposase
MFNMAKKFDPAYKLEVCKQVESGATTAPEISKETGIHQNTLCSWLRHYRENKGMPFVGSGNVLPVNEEIVRLRRENKELREEVYILKNAAAYFAKYQK